jgi:hypothetical protein
MKSQIVYRKSLEYVHPNEGDTLISMITSPVAEGEYPVCIDIVHNTFNNDGSVSSKAIRLSDSEIARLAYWLRDMYKDGEGWSPKQ